MNKNKFTKPKIIGSNRQKSKDFYFLLMDASWPQVVLFVLATFLFLNLVFACIYYLNPGSISNAQASSFKDAFFFSVHTLSTIGYGVMSPGNDIGNFVVTIESFTALTLFTIVTGFMFAKASKPRASLLFSNKILVTKMYGKDTLIFRVGNARGNDVIDASVDVTVLVEETTPEGHQFRKAHDLELVRKRTPFFALTWTIMHVIDDKSPLKDILLKDSQLNYINVTLTAHDGTFGQTIYDRHVYYPQDLILQARFEDVISLKNKGRDITVDYTKFHDIIRELP
jgi:inward rectifier potassium channel